jgi:hypothetical protein
MRTASIVCSAEINTKVLLLEEGMQTEWLLRITKYLTQQ